MAMAAKDLKGKVVGKLQIIEPTEKRTKNKSVVWKCKCLVCEHIVYKSSIKITEGRFSRSCGCLEYVKNPRTPPGHSGLNSLFRGYQEGAARRNLCFELSRSKFREITSSNCYYCGKEPDSIRYGSRGAKKEYGKYIFSGVDRFDNSIGYTVENSVPCCSSCNYAKRDMSMEEFSNWALQLAGNLKNIT